MDSTTPEEYVSVIGTHFLYPITTLLETLESFSPKGPNEVQASPLENGYSASIIVLAVLMLESAIGRTQYVRGEKPPKKPVQFIRSAYPSSGFVDKIEELFVIRDVIAHNHIWEAKFVWSEEAGMKLVSAELREGYGKDSKFVKALDTTSRTTRLLGLNLFPTRICRADAVTVLKNATEFLLFLENEDRRYFYLSPQPVKYRGNMTPFTKLVASL